MGYYISVDEDVKIYVEDINPKGKKTILFLHGWPGNRMLFEYQYNQLPKYGFRCIGIDTRGFGKSDRPFYGYDYDTLAEDVKVVVDTLNLYDFTLVGHSTGGAIAARYMGRYNGYGVSKLALIAAAAPSLIKRPNFPYGLDKETVLQIIKDTYDDHPKMLVGFGNIFFYQYTSEPFMDWFFQLGLQAPGWSTVAVAETWMEDVLFEDLVSIQVPTIIIHGIHDKVVPFELGQIQHEMISGSMLVPFEFSGHGSFYDQKDLFNETLMKFIDR